MYIIPSPLSNASPPSPFHTLNSYTSVPELRIYQIRDGPIGPHTVGMFEVNVFTPQQFGAFVSWLVINRGPLSALVHPNTNMEERDHTQRATWMGEQMPLDLSLFKMMAGEDARKMLLG